MLSEKGLPGLKVTEEFLRKLGRASYSSSFYLLSKVFHILRAQSSNSTEREVSFPFYQSSERSTHLSKVSELGSGRVQIQIQAYPTPTSRAPFLPGCRCSTQKTVADQPLTALLIHSIFKKWQSYQSAFIRTSGKTSS